MSTGESWKTIGLRIFHTQRKECGDGSCGCGCGDAPFVAVKTPQKAAESECCELVCGPETCGSPEDPAQH
jgi:hypothetical protein